MTCCACVYVSQYSPMVSLVLYPDSLPPAILFGPNEMAGGSGSGYETRFLLLLVLILLNKPNLLSILDQHC